ncbi:hypothetical protein [Thioalkalivibrio sp. ALJT]|uniref:hypothetical protein n=1 Tax=Thioalkalivibrio sp. ALJT TaxID=1158146 RepID=UPI00035F0AB8|nr:hypothetical protein [Thioalkalivibrio sp. ALJT]
MSALRLHRILAFLLLVSVGLAHGPARADLAADLQALNGGAIALNNQLAMVNLAAGVTCPALLEANQSARDLVNGITAINAGLAAPLSVDAATMEALDDLFDNGLALANEALLLSLRLDHLGAVGDDITLVISIAAMLQLSNDIGTMADRIGEMADNILVMADNIGEMADRILVTQDLQSRNVALTMDSILQTRNNILAVVSVMEDASYAAELSQLVMEGGRLSVRMRAVMFRPWRMDRQLRSIVDDVQDFQADVISLRHAINAAAKDNQVHLGPRVFMELGSLSLMMQSLTTALDGYVIAINGLAPMTSDPTLARSMDSILELSADIGLMANRILEMSGQILAMADNIGTQADLILDTQQAMNMNIAASQASILAAQEWAVGIIEARDL